MSAGIYSIYIEQGATFSLTTTITDSNGAPIDLTGSTFAGKIRSYAGSTTVIATFTIALTANPGEIEITLTPLETAAISAPTNSTNPVGTTQYVYDVEWTKPDLTVKRLLQGDAIVSPEVTR